MSSWWWRLHPGWGVDPTHNIHVYQVTPSPGPCDQQTHAIAKLHVIPCCTTKRVCFPKRETNVFFCSFASLLRVQVHECHHPHPSPAVAEHLTCVQVHECHHPHPSPAVAEHLTCVQVHECHHPHPTPPPIPLFSCKIHKDHGTVPATNITPDNGWLEDEISFWDAIFAERLPLVLGTMTCMSSIALRYFPTSSMDFIWMLSDWMMVLCPWKIRWVTNKTVNF